MTVTKGSAAFDEWCAAERGRAHALGLLCRASASTVSQWRSGRVPPAEVNRIAIEDRAGIPRALWSIPAETSEPADDPHPSHTPEAA